MKFKLLSHFFKCNLKYTNYNKSRINNEKKEKPNILIICTFSVFGGIEMHCLSLYKNLKKFGYNVEIIIPQNSILEKIFLEKRLSFYSYKQTKFLKPNRQPGLNNAILNIIKKHNINIIHCNRAKDTHLLRNIPDGIKLIFTRHAPSLIKKKYMKKFDAIIGVNKNFIKNAQKKFPNKKIIHLTPFFLEEDSLLFKPKLNKKDFFKKEFNIQLPNYPIITQIASLSNVKNHVILLKAIHKLVINKAKHLNVLLCGDGYKKKSLQRFAKKLKIQDHIYFLGFTNKKTEVLYFSDIKTLTSKEEAHSISLMEAALLKKPLIGPTNTGAINTIINKKTGLLFENGNANDLAEKIELLLDNPELREQYGQNAYDHVNKNYVSKILLKKLNNIHKKILNEN